MPCAARAAALAGLLIAAFSAHAQDDCILDHCADHRPPASRGFDGYPSSLAPDTRVRGRPGDFDFYVLALSWLPGFCAVDAGDARDRDQCRRGAGIGFTVHGLWPQYDHGFPSDCRGYADPSRAVLAATEGTYPDPSLARHEWRKHGTCSGLSPRDYFNAVRDARNAVTIPASFNNLHEDERIAPAAVMRAFTGVNPRLRPGMLAVQCRRGTLDEVRICFGKNLKGFQPCPDVVRRACRTGDLMVPALR